jgi:hypothetical protein
LNFPIFSVGHVSDAGKGWSEGHIYSFLQKGSVCFGMISCLQIILFLYSFPDFFDTQRDKRMEIFEVGIWNRLGHFDNFGFLFIKYTI